MTLIERWTEEINKMRNEIMAFGMGVNNQEVGGSFFSRNKTKLYTFALFGTVGLIGYLTGFLMLTVISGIVMGLQVCSWVWGWMKDD